MHIRLCKNALVNWGGGGGGGEGRKKKYKRLRQDRIGFSELVDI